MYSLKLSIKIAAKPLQMETWLLLTAYRKSPAVYNSPFNHNTARLAYYSTLWLFKVIRSYRFSCHLKTNMRLPV